MKKRLRKKISKKYINHEIIVTSIKEIESDYNYIVYFQTLDNLKNFQVQILKYMENYKYIATLKLCAIKQSIPECVYVIVCLVKILKNQWRENKLRRIDLIKK